MYRSEYSSRPQYVNNVYLVHNQVYKDINLYTNMKANDSKYICLTFDLTCIKQWACPASAIIDYRKQVFMIYITKFKYVTGSLSHYDP